MRRAMTGAAAAVVLLAGCAHAAPPLPAALPSASSATSASTPASATPSAGASTSAAASGTPSSGLKPTVAPKALSTVKLPDTFGTYQASSPTGTGGQQVVYTNPANAKDTLNVVVTPLADASAIASAYTNPALNGPAICGTVTSNSTTVASCALPLDTGAIVVTGSGTQTLDAVATATSALWAALQ